MIIKQLGECLKCRIVSLFFDSEFKFFSRMLDLQMRNFDLSDLDGKKDDLYGSELLQVSISKQVLKKDTTLKIFHLRKQ